MTITPTEVHKTLSKYMLADGLDLVLDLRKSKGCRVYNARTQQYMLDGFSFFASAPLGCNPPKLTTPEFMKLIAGSQSLGTYVLAENKDDEAIIVLIPFEEVVRVATVREFKEQMDDLKITEGMLIPLNRFTYTAEREARNFSIAVLRKNHPVFNIFSHSLVPEHQILTSDEIDEILVQYNARISNLPKLFEDDPAAIAVNAQIGDVVRILRSHDNFMYRLVIPRVEAGITAESVMADMMMDRRKRLGKKK